MPEARTPGAGTGALPDVQPTWRSEWLVVLLALAPIVAHFVAKELIWPRPHWGFFSDPEVIFAYSGIDMIEGRSPSHVEHPGMPLHLLNAMSAAVAGTSPLHIPRVLFLGCAASLALGVAATWALTRTVLRGLPLPASLAALWCYWLCPQALFRTSVLSPETLFYGVAGLATAAVFHAFSGPPSTRRVALAGAALGVCVSLKFTFVPWVAAYALAILFAYRSEPATALRRAALAIGGALGAFGIAIVPALGRLDVVFGLVTAMITRRGVYGSGAADAPEVSQLGDHVETILVSATTWHAWVVVCAALLTAAVFSHRRAERPFGPSVNGPLVFGAAAFLLTYPGVLKTGNIRYLMPSGIALILLLAIAVRVAPWSRYRTFCWGLAAVAGILTVRAVVHDVSDHRNWTEFAVESRLRIESIASERAGAGREPVIVWSRRSPHPAFSLGMYAETEEQRQVVHAAFPHSGWYNMYRYDVHLPRAVRPWDVVVLAASDVARFPEPLGEHLATMAWLQVYARPR